MRKRTLKQIIIAAVFFFILAGIVFLVYFFNQPGPTCFDGIKNQEEEEIDCGGPCVSCELSEIEDIQVLWTKSVPTQNNFFDLVAQIRNPNQNYGVGTVPFIFEVYDTDGNPIAQSSGQTYILPNQTKYIIEPKVKISQSWGEIKISFGEIKWDKLTDYQAPNLAIQQKEYRLLDYREPGFSQARGVLVNKSSFDFNKVSINVLLFDSSGQLVGLNITEMNTLLSGQERDFIVTWFNKIDNQVVLVEMEAETNVFDPDNYLSSGQDIRGGAFNY